MVNVQRLPLVLGSLQFQRGHNGLLFAQLDHDYENATGLGESGVLYFGTVPAKVFHNMVQLPVGTNVNHDNGTADLFDFTGIIVGR